FQSIKNKGLLFQTEVETHDPDIILGCETWLDDSIPDSLYFPNSYQVFRRDRNSHGGGICICVKQQLNATLVSVHKELEIMWVDISFQYRAPVKLGVVYKPDRNLKTIDDLIIDIKQFELSKNPSTLMLLYGDLNLPNFNWKQSICSNNIENLKVNELLDTGLAQLVDSPTRVTEHSSTLLDVLLTNQPQVIDGISDHKSLLEIAYKLPTLPDRKIFMYHKANVKDLR